MIERLKILQANKGQFANGSELFNRLQSDDRLRSEVEILSKTFLHISVQGCSNCYMDAYAQLINLNIKKMAEKIEAKFKLRAGALLRDKGGNSKYLCSNANLTDKLALYHLKTNPKYAELFDVLPNNWEELVEEFELTEEESKADAGRKVDVETKLVEARNRILQMENEYERTSKIVGCIVSNEFKAAIALLTREELIRFIPSYNIELGVTDEMTDDEIRNALLAELDKDDDEPEQVDDQKNGLVDSTGDIVQTGFNEQITKSQEDLEAELVLEIAEKLKTGTLKKDIQDGYKSVEKLGEKNLTVRFLAELITRAEDLIKE